MNHGRLRPDRCALELEKSGEAQTHKHQLEERQRAEKKKRTEDGDEWSPRWFRLDDELQSSLRDHSTPQRTALRGCSKVSGEESSPRSRPSTTTRRRRPLSLAVPDME